jgi:hypothetical protein
MVSECKTHDINLIRPRSPIGSRQTVGILQTATAFFMMRAWYLSIAQQFGCIEHARYAKGPSSPCWCSSSCWLTSWDVPCAVAWRFRPSYPSPPCCNFDQSQVAGRICTRSAPWFRATPCPPAALASRPYVSFARHPTATERDPWLRAAQGPHIQARNEKLCFVGALVG